MLDNSLILHNLTYGNSYSDEEKVSLTRFLCEICEGHEVVILGDFNLPSIVWSDEGEMLGGEGKIDRMFMDCFNTAGLTQWVLEPTFVSSGNTLDLFLTSELDRVGAVTVYASFSKCGHSPVVCDYLFMLDSDLDTNVYDEIQLKYLWHRGYYCRMCY